MGLFCQDLTATQISNLSGVSRPTINKLLLHFRQTITCYCEEQSPVGGLVEIDESYFGPKRMKGKKGRGAGRKIVVFGILKRQGMVYAQIVPNASRPALKQVIQQRIDSNSIIYTDGWKSYDGLVDWGYKKHYRIYHGHNQFANGQNHINGIENFWGVAKVRLAKLRGLKKEYFNPHLKECEFRYNMRHDNLYQKLLEILRQAALKNGP